MPSKEKIIIGAIFLSTVFFLCPKTNAAAPSAVINEIAWMGTSASASDEWLELYNNTTQEIVLEGWKLTEGEGTVIIVLKGTIAPGAYYLIERTDDTTVSDIAADLKGSWGGSGLSNSGEKIQLLDNNLNLVDEINCSTGWFAGKASPDYKTIERINPSLSGNLAENWATNDGSALIGHDSQGNPIKGTPKAKNSVAGISLTTPTPPSPSPAIPSSSPSPAPPASASPIPAASPALTTSPSATPTPYQFSQNIFINEFLPYPSKDELEWVELFNGGSQTIDLTGWGLSDSTASHQPFQVSSGTKIEPGACLVISLSKSFLNNDGDQVKLLWPDGQVVHSVSYPKAKQNFSCSRFDNQWLWTNQPTPGQANKKSSLSQPLSFSAAGAADATDATPPTIATLQESVTEQKPSSNQKTAASPALNASPSPPASTSGSGEKQLAASTAQPLSKSSRPKTILSLISVLSVAALAALFLIRLRRRASIDND